MYNTYRYTSGRIPRAFLVGRSLCASFRFLPINRFGYYSVRQLSAEYQQIDFIKTQIFKKSKYFDVGNKLNIRMKPAYKQM